MKLGHPSSLFCVRLCDEQKIFREGDERKADVAGENGPHHEKREGKSRLRILFTVHCMISFLIKSYHSVTEFNSFLCFCFHRMLLNNL